MAENSNIKEYKQFTTATNIRKFTQQIINPVIKGIEQQMTSLLQQNTQIRTDIAKIDQIYLKQNDILKQIHSTQANLQKYKDQQSQIKRHEDKKIVKLETATEKMIIEIQSMKNLIKRQNQYIEEMNGKNSKMNALYANIDSRNDQAIKNMQQKFNNFNNQALKRSKQIQSYFHKTQSQIGVINQTFKRQRNAMEQKFKRIQLYQSQRQEIFDKIQDIFAKMILKASREQFQGYRKSQAIMIKDKMAQIDNQILQLIPMSLREVLPEIQIRLRQTDKIGPLINKTDQLQDKLSKMSLKINQNKNQSENRGQQLEKKLTKNAQKIKNQLQNRIDALNQISQRETKQLRGQIIDKTMKIQQQFGQKLQKQTLRMVKLIQKQIQAQIVTTANQKDQQLWNQVNQIKQIKQKLMNRSDDIQEIGNNIDKKLESYSSRITKVKSDYEIFADATRKQVSSVIKFKNQFKNNLCDIGSILSNIAQCLLITGSMHYENYNNTISNHNSHNKINTKQHEVFVTNNDGIILQSNGRNKIYRLQYRKQNLDPKIFIRSYMFSLVTFLDEIFEKYQFLDWKNQKPSEFFNERCFDNYILRMSKMNQSKPLKSNNFTTIQISKQIPRQVSRQLQNDEFQDATMEFNCSKNLHKGLSRTIQSRIGGIITRNQKNANLQEKTNQMRKSYSIKKPRSTAEKNNHEQNFLSTRTACRSRISQAN